MFDGVRCQVPRRCAAAHGGHDHRRRLDPSAAGKQRGPALGHLRAQRQPHRARHETTAGLARHQRGGHRGGAEHDAASARGHPGTAIVSGTCGRVAIYNRLYGNVHHGGSWFPTTASNQLGVAMVNVAETGTGSHALPHKRGRVGDAPAAVRGRTGLGWHGWHQVTRLLKERRQLLRASMRRKAGQRRTKASHGAKGHR